MLYEVITLGEVEKVGGMREVQVAVRVESAGELLRLVFEVGLDGELGAELVLDAGMLGRTLAAEALFPFSYNFV